MKAKNTLVIIALIACVVLLAFAARISETTALYGDLLSACLIAGIVVLLLKWQQDWGAGRMPAAISGQDAHAPKSSWLHFGLVCCLPYVLVLFPFLLSPYLPIHDSWDYHFPVFQYLSQAVSQGTLFPAWIPASGGVRIGLFHINFFTVFPHRILGYLLNAVLPISDILAYKLQYLFGIMLIGGGWWLFLKELTGSRYAADFGTLAVMLGGTGITLHQEQVIATATLLPWMLLSLWKLQHNSRYIFPLLILFGLGLSTHYPHIHLMTMGLVLGGALLFRRGVFKRTVIAQKRWLWLLPFFVVLASLPTLYLFFHLGQVDSSLRTIRSGSYQEYAALNTLQYSSAQPEYLRQYLTWSRPEQGTADDPFSFFVGRVTLFAVVLAFFFRPKMAGLLLGFLCLATGLTLGTNSPLPFPQLLYALHIPFIGSFRQWIHFFPFINFCLAALGAIGIAGLERMTGNLAKHAKSMLLLLCFLLVFDLAMYGREYFSLFFHSRSPVRLTERFFSRKNQIPTDIFQYARRSQLSRSCADAIPTTSILTANIVSVAGGQQEEIETACRFIAERSGKTVTNFPPATLSVDTGNEFFESVSCQDCVQTDGLVFEVNTPTSVLFVTPLNYDLNAQACIDGTETEIWRVNGALSGVWIEQGQHRIEFKIPHDAYLAIIVIQLALYAVVAGYFCIKT